MFNDLRYGARTFLRHKAWTAVVVLSIALGIGANTALFSAVNSLFLTKLPVKDPDSLVRLRWAGQNDMVTDSSEYGFSSKDAAGLAARTTFSYPMFQQFVADNRTMMELAACAPYGRVNVVIDGQAEIASAFISSGNFYRMLGLTASPGRTIVPEDDRPTAPPVAVIGARYWRSRFGGDPHVVGKTVRINNLPVTIVGVISPELHDVQQAVRTGPDIAVPLAVDPQLGNNPERAPSRSTSIGPSSPAVLPRLEQPTYWWLQVMGRVRPGITAEQVQANLEAVFQHTARAGLDAYLAALPAQARSNSNNRNRTAVPHLRVDSGSRGIYDVSTSDSTAVLLLSVVVVLILSIVCANVANLLLSRATMREREISVRLSLGATRRRLVRQLLTESVLLAGMGGALGLVAGHWAQRLLPGPAGHAVPLDWHVMAFVLVVTFTAGILFGVAPALRATGKSVSAALKESGQSVARSGSLLSRSLLVLQVAISLVLLVAAGLFLRTLQNLRSVDAGFNTRNLVLFRVSPLLNRYDDVRIAALYEQLIDRLQSVPGVRAVAVSSTPLLSGSISSTGIFVAGRTYPPGARDSINRLVISPGFFVTMEMPIRAGRSFTERDNQSAPKVAVINEAAARKYFPNDDPIGQHIGSSLETAGQLEIVGVLRDAKYNSLREPAPPTLYVPFLQTRMPTAVFQVRTAGEPLSAIGSLREAVRAIDPNLPLMNVSTQLDEAEKRLLQERTFAQAYTLFGVLALLIASVGLFGLMSYTVGRRTSEIGIRMALGAERRDVLWLVMKESMTLVVAGVIIGLTGALAAGRLVDSLLFGLAATDARTLFGATALMMVVSASAGYLPARRAALVDPLKALRSE